MRLEPLANASPGRVLGVTLAALGLAFVLVPAFGWLLLGEPLHWQTLVGGVLILAGVALAAQVPS